MALADSTARKHKGEIDWAAFMKGQVVSVPVAYTMEQAAREIPCSRRWLQDFLVNKPADAEGNPFFYEIGNRKMFTATDIERIRQSTREDVRCRLSSSRRVRGSRRTTMAVVPTSESLLTEAQRLTGSRLQRGLLNSGNMTSKVVALPRTKDQHS
jgi:hypothetical protein